MKPAQQELAKQITTYADAITAFSFVQSAAFGFALAGHEFRESMLRIPHHWIWGVPFAYFAYIGLVVLLWWGYRTDIAATKDERKSREYRLGRDLWWGRIGVIVLALALSSIAIGLTIHGAQSPTGSISVTVTL